MASEWKYEINDLVWAKMKGFPPWPGRVSTPTNLLKPLVKNNLRCIYFFGTENYASIETSCLKPYFPFKDTLSLGCKTRRFREACKAIEEFIETISGPQNNTNNGVSENPSYYEIIENKTGRMTEEIIEQVESASVCSHCISTLNSTSGSALKKRKNESQLGSNLDNEKSKLKKVCVNLPTDNTDIFELKNNLSRPQREKNNTLLNKPEVLVMENTPKDTFKVSKYLLNKNISPSDMKFGFIGLGNMGSGIVKNLLNSGHIVYLWNRSLEKCVKFIEAGALAASTPCDVVLGSDITFTCISDPKAVRDIVFGKCGILSEIGIGKSFVEMSGIDPKTSQDISEAVLNKGGRYMEVVIQGSKTEADKGSLVCMAAGDEELFDDCKSVFRAITKKSFYLGDTGSATKMNLILQTVKAISVAGLAEGIALADRAGISPKDVIDFLGTTSLKCPLLMEKGKAIMINNLQTDQALKHLQKDLSLSLNWAGLLEQSCPISITVNEVLKHGKRLRYSDHNTS